MKKAAFTVLAVALLFSFCACACQREPDRSSGDTNISDSVTNTFYLMKEFDLADLSYEDIETFFLEQGYKKSEAELTGYEKVIGFVKLLEGETRADSIFFHIASTVEEAKQRYQDQYSQALILYRSKSHCRINNMLIYATNRPMNELVAHFGLEEEFRNVILEEDYSIEEVLEVLRELGFLIYGNTERGDYEAMSPSGRTYFTIFVYQNSQEFENACANIPFRLSDEEYALESPIDPYTTMLAFRKGRFILIGDMDWLYLVRTRLEQAA